MRSNDAGHYEDLLISNRETVVEKIASEDLKVGMNLDSEMEDWSEITEIKNHDGIVYINPVDYAHKDDGPFFCPVFEVGEMVPTYKNIRKEMSESERIARLENVVNRLIHDNDSLRSTLEHVIKRDGTWY